MSRSDSELARKWGRVSDELLADLWHQVAMIRYREAMEQAIAEGSADFSVGVDFARYRRGLECGAVRALRAEQWMRKSR